jgi:hypothetical protein
MPLGLALRKAEYFVENSTFSHVLPSMPTEAAPLEAVLFLNQRQVSDGLIAVLQQDTTRYRFPADLQVSAKIAKWLETLKWWSPPLIRDDIAVMRDGQVVYQAQYGGTL